MDQAVLLEGMARLLKGVMVLFLPLVVNSNNSLDLAAMVLLKVMDILLKQVFRLRTTLPSRGFLDTLLNRGFLDTLLNKASLPHTELNLGNPVSQHSFPRHRGHTPPWPLANFLSLASFLNLVNLEAFRKALEEVIRLKEALEAIPLKALEPIPLKALEVFLLKALVVIPKDLEALLPL